MFAKNQFRRKCCLLLRFLNSPLSAPPRAFLIELRCLNGLDRKILRRFLEDLKGKLLWFSHSNAPFNLHQKLRFKLEGTITIMLESGGICLELFDCRQDLRT